MAELGHNYNIQCMKLFQELKAAHPATPDEVVRQCMKLNRNAKGKCMEDLDLANGSQKHFLGRYNQGKYGKNNSRRYSAGALIESTYSVYHGNKQRTNSFSEASSCPKFWTARAPPRERRPLCALPTNCDKRGGEEGLEPPRKISRHSDDQSNVPDEVQVSNNNILAKVCSSREDCDLENNWQPSGVASLKWRRRGIPRPLSLQPEEDDSLCLPTVVVTPDSPPQDSGPRSQVQTLYSPQDQATVETRLIQHMDKGPNSLENEISNVLNSNTDNSMVICGRNNSITKTFIDILPGVGPVNLPFGQTFSETIEDRIASTSVTQSTTSLSQGTVHYLKDIGDGTISIATTTYCGIQHSITTPSMGEENTKPSSKSTTVLYSVNRKPVICENPFRKVFTRRKQFYQAKEGTGRPVSPETSSKKLIWAHHNHNCQDIPPETPPAPPQQQYFTLNANIQPFDPFIIKHSISGPRVDNTTSPECASVNLTLCGETDAQPTSVQLLPNGNGLKYITKVEEDGTEASLEVNVKKDQSTITTLRTGTTDCTSNEISVKLVDGGNTVNIQQSQCSFPRPEQKPVRPSSLNIPGPKYATARHTKSMYQGRGTSPMTSPRYNSLPNLKGVMYENCARDPTWGYQSHPKDEERKLAFTRALLSHQMNQLFKLEHELRLEKIDLDHEKVEVQDLEMEVKQRALKTQFVEVKKLEHDIGDLRGSVDNMVKKVTDLTGGKVPLGEDSITDYKPYLSQEPAVPDAPHCDVAPVFRANPDPSAPAHADKWSCSECTFANHPSLDTCEMCEMPRITMGTNQQRHQPGPCFCHPQDRPGSHHAFPPSDHPPSTNTSHHAFPPTHHPARTNTSSPPNNNSTTPPALPCNKHESSSGEASSTQAQPPSQHQLD